MEALAESYELEGQGQLRFWIKQRPTNSCLASYANAVGHSLCRQAHKCLSCCAKHTEDKDKQDGLSATLSVAAVSLLEKTQVWESLPTDKIFDFSDELDQGLKGAAD